MKIGHFQVVHFSAHLQCHRGFVGQQKADYSLQVCHKVLHLQLWYLCNVLTVNVVPKISYCRCASSRYGDEIKIHVSGESF